MRRASPRRPLPLTILTILYTVLGGSALANTESMTGFGKSKNDSVPKQSSSIFGGIDSIDIKSPPTEQAKDNLPQPYPSQQLQSTAETFSYRENVDSKILELLDNKTINITVSSTNKNLGLNASDNMILYNDSRCKNCVNSDKFDTGHSELLRKVRSQSSENVSSVSIENKTSSTFLESRLKALSQVLEQVGNSTYSALEIENLVRSKMNDTQKSSLGSVDVMVPSLAGMGEEFLKSVESRANYSSGSSKNKSTVQRLGRTDAPMLNYIFDTYSSQNKHHHRNDRFGGPKFESTGGELSVDTDADAELDCRISSLQDKFVSWARRRPGDDNLDLLTVGQHTYTGDTRFSVDFRQPDNWRLVLRGARSNDSGTYECQVSTHPPLILRQQLSVNAPIVKIVEAGGRELRDKYYERNSTLKLACRIRHLRAHAVFWAHAGRILNDDTLRGGVSVKTETVEGGADSTLLVARLNASDSGRYTCSVGQDLQAVVNVHVLNESLAELHQGAGSHIQSPSPWSMLLIIMILSIFADQICEDIFQMKASEAHQSHFTFPSVQVR